MKVGVKSRELIARLLTRQNIRPLEAYGVAFLVFGLAVLARVPIDTVIGYKVPFITFIPAVVVVVLLSGIIPGIIIAIASGVTGALWVSPQETHEPIYYVIRFGLFAVIAALLLGLLATLKVAYIEHKNRDEQLMMINGELTHRIANLFTIASVLTSQTIRNGSTHREMIESVNARFAALASAQKLLTSNTQNSVKLNAIVKGVLQPFSPGGVRLKTDGPATAIPSDIATNLALVLNELATNAMKYGAWSSPNGEVRLSWRDHGDRIVIDWSEHEGPTVNMPTRIGAGTTLIKNALGAATVEYNLKPMGAHCIIEIPIARVETVATGAAA